MFINNNTDTSVFIVNFDQVNAGWVTIYTMQPHCKSKNTRRIGIFNKDLKMRLKVLQNKQCSRCGHPNR